MLKPPAIPVPAAIRRLRLALAVAMLAGLALLAAPGAVLADCMPPPPIEESVKTAEVVFVGTVLETSNRGTWANVEVEEVWRGPDQQAIVLIRGGPAGNAATSIDRSFEVGVKYIFLPLIQAGEGLTDNSCSNTQPWSEALVALRPTDVRQPLGGEASEAGFDFGGLIPIVGIVGLAFVAILAVGLLARGRHDA